MNIQSVNHDGAIIALTADEVMIIANALNEVCNGLDIEEFSIRMGATYPEVDQLRVRLEGIYRRQEGDKANNNT